MSVNRDQWGNVNTYNFSKVCDFAGSIAASLN